LALEGKPIINMELEAQTCGHHNLIDAVKLALEDENAHQYQSYQGIARIAKKVADFI
jgi:aspartate/methionine/tyrosine aminotransferase